MWFKTFIFLRCELAGTVKDSTVSYTHLGVSNSNNTYAIQDRDISTVYIYLCDYYEYMDELKGYYWSDDYEEKAKTKTFKQLLDERAVASAEVHFDTDK